MPRRRIKERVPGSWVSLTTGLEAVERRKIS
jgi:hypothetical protein